MTNWPDLAWPLIVSVTPGGIKNCASWPDLIYSLASRQGAHHLSSARHIKIARASHYSLSFPPTVHSGQFWSDTSVSEGLVGNANHNPTQSRNRKGKLQIKVECVVISTTNHLKTFLLLRRVHLCVFVFNLRSKTTNSGNLTKRVSEYSFRTNTKIKSSAFCWTLC